jgi:cobaltochelatase CobS
MNFSEVTCAECGHSAHILLPHLREVHNWVALDYQLAHPEAPVASPLGQQLLQRYVHEEDVFVPRQSHTTTLAEVMTGVVGFEKGPPLKVRRFEGPSRYLPPGDDTGYYYDFDCTLLLCYALERPSRNALWLSGYSGTGKTCHVLHLCRRLGREVIRINLDSSITRADLIGDWVVREGSTRFQYGLLPIAMRRGAVLLLDEFDLGNPYIVALFRPVLEDNPRLVLLENGGEVVVPHPDFRVVATANTWGNGDASGLYGTTQSLSLADRQRFSLFAEMCYLKPPIEAQMLLDVVPDLDEEEARQFVKVANAIRAQFAAGKIEESISPRQLINWAEMYCEIGFALRAAVVTFLQPLSPSTAMAVRQILVDTGSPLVKREEMRDD